jgi:UDP-N-acetylglucosamine acyltransferase
MPIHPTAVIDARATIAADADIGPYVVIDGPVRVGPRTRVAAHATLMGWTEIGADNIIHDGAVVGDTPQDLAFAGEESYVRVGDRNVIREHVQVHRGTKPGSATTIGNDNYLMATSHVGHNCRIGNHVLLTNGAMLGGYVEVEDQAIISGNCAVHQFVRVGAHSYIGGGAMITQDVLPFSMTSAARETHAYGLNKVGMERRGFSKERIRKIQQAYKILLTSKRNTTQALEKLK